MNKAYRNPLELPGVDSNVITALILLTGCLPLLLDQVVPPLGIPLSILAIWLLLRWQGQSMTVVGVVKPVFSWPRTILMGLAGALLLLSFDQFVYPSLLGLFGLSGQDLSSYEGIEGNNGLLAIYLTVSWTTAGFGEELIFRGFLMAGLARIFGNTRAAWVMALVVTNVLFGLIHIRTGWGGVVSTGVNGALLAGVYLLSRRSIWAAWIAHSMANTVSFLLIYTGWYKLFI